MLTAALTAWIALVVALVVAQPQAGLLREALRILPDVLRLIRRLAADETLPRGVRIRLGLLLAYLATPIDLIPDLIPVLGYADDAIIVTAVLRVVFGGGATGKQGHTDGRLLEVVIEPQRGGDAQPGDMGQAVPFAFYAAPVGPAVELDAAAGPGDDVVVAGAGQPLQIPAGPGGPGWSSGSSGSPGRAARRSASNPSGTVRGPKGECVMAVVPSPGGVLRLRTQGSV